MMGEHLRIVLALLFNIDNENLLDPESPLHEVVLLEKTFDFPERPALPDAVHVEPELRVVYNVLCVVSSLTT